MATRKVVRGQVGRPSKSIPEPIPDTPENVARALMSARPKREARNDYLKKDKDNID